MTTQRDDVLDRVAGLLEPTPEALPNFHRRMRRRHRNRRISAYATVAALVAIAVVAIAMVRNEPTPPVPADDPTPTEGLGIFAPVAGRIVYNTTSNSSLWAIDPNAPSPVVGVVRLSPGGAADADRFAPASVPLGWSSDGTELLFQRVDPAKVENDCQGWPCWSLYILHADGSETQVTSEPFEGAAISPDGSRVLYTTDESKWFYVIDAEGGQPARISATEAFSVDGTPTFSPDGTQIAYLSSPRNCCAEPWREHVWVANADGTDAHEILSDEPALGERGLFERITWSPAGDRIAMENSLGGHLAIYTFAPDGSDFTKVITGGASAFWSPDGSQIAYQLPGVPQGLHIADADGSNVRSVGFGSSGPWHPGE
jgi:Tol biopolymer transport system component